MRSFQTTALALVGLFLSASVVAQRSPSVAPQALPFLRRSFAALTGGARVRDVTLTGTATRYDASGSESGTIALAAVGVWQSQFKVNLPSGARSQTRTFSKGIPSETGSGPAGVFYTLGSQDLMTAPAWFFPAFVLAPGLSSSGYTTSYVGNETRSGIAVVHLTISQQMKAVSAAEAATIHPLTRHDIYLDRSSFLPVAVTFNLADSSGAPNVPVGIRYSNYRQIRGGRIAFHIQAYVQNALLWDIQLSSASINAGAAIAPSAN